MLDAWVDFPTDWADGATAWQPVAVPVTVDSAGCVWTAHTATATVATTTAVQTPAACPAVQPGTTTARTTGLPSAAPLSLATQPATVATAIDTVAAVDTARALWTALAGSTSVACRAGAEAAALAVDARLASGQPHGEGGVAAQALAFAGQPGVAAVQAAVAVPAATLVMATRTIGSGAEACGSWRCAAPIAPNRRFRSPVIAGRLVEAAASVETRCASPLPRGARTASPPQQHIRFTPTVPQDRP